MWFLAGLMALSSPFADASFDLACICFALPELPSSVRESVVREMMRVLRSGGTFAAVDYAHPRNPIAAQLVFQCMRLYERDQYVEFIRSDLLALLRWAGVRVEEDRAALPRVARIVRGSRPLTP